MPKFNSPLYTIFFLIFLVFLTSRCWGCRVPVGVITAVGIDEISYKKGHKYLTMVYQIDENVKRLLWVGKERTEKTLESYFKWFGEERTALLRFFCTDMWGPYLTVIERYKSKDAINILDRYHIMSTLNKRIDEVRRWEAKQLKAKGIEWLKSSRWCFLKRPKNLTSRQCETLSNLLGLNLKTVKAYLMKEDFQRFWSYVYPKNAYWGDALCHCSPGE